MSGSLTIGIPCHNEALTVGKVVADFRREFPEARVLVIDNASADATAEIARAGGAEVVSEPRKGKGYAVRRLFEEADSDWLLMVDGDDTYPAEEAHKLLACAVGSGCDTVVGVRTSRDPVAFKTSHTWANDFLARLIERVFGQPCGDLFSGYRLFSAAFYRNVPVLSTGFEVETEIMLQTLDKGFSQRNLPVDFRARPEGSFSKLDTFGDGSRVLRVLVMLIKDYRPLQFFIAAGLLLLAAALLAGMFPVWEYLRFRYIFRVPLALLATGLTILAGLSFASGLILDTVVRHRREEFSLRMRDYRRAARRAG